MITKEVLYKVVSCNNAGVTLQAANKAVIFHLTWKEILLPENICSINKSQIFFLGTYYSHNMRNLNLNSILANDSEIKNITKVILSEIRSNVYLLMDVKTKKLETLSIKFILENMELLNDFTCVQSFFIGVRIGDIYDKSNLKFT
jgi:hypothetical protein